REPPWLVFPPSVTPLYPGPQITVRWQNGRSDSARVSPMKLHQFRNVLEIAERGSLRAAARSMRIAQPALTRSLGELERELGASLFERRARGMVLTPIGQAFVRRASAVINEVNRARDEVNQLGGGRGGSVAVGLSIAPHIAMLPRALRPFRTRYPDVQL